MIVNGKDCWIGIKTDSRETGIPYAVETIREAVSLLTEEAAIEGEGTRRAIRKSGQQAGLGVTGCVVTPLAIGTAPLFCTWLWGRRICRSTSPKPGTFTVTNWPCCLWKTVPGLMSYSIAAGGGNGMNAAP
jgi:hypothetical protein